MQSTVPDAGHIYWTKPIKPWFVVHVELYPMATNATPVQNRSPVGFPPYLLLFCSFFYDILNLFTYNIDLRPYV